MLNHVSIMGLICNDIELRRTPSGAAVTSFTLAVDRDFKNENGEKDTDFIDIVAWKNTAEFVHKYFAKGRTAIVAGRLQVRNWTDKNNNKRKTVEVVADSVYFGDSKKEDSGSNSYSGNSYGGGYQTTAQLEPAYSANNFDMMEGDDAQLPF